ncbi:hypothetical protein G6F31_019223 [Rhizopus arrhizus]|nr:hypothetical protein G6F31_019223 [Rhizopus arrhizus]
MRSSPRADTAAFWARVPDHIHPRSAARGQTPHPPAYGRCSGRPTARATSSIWSIWPSALIPEGFMATAEARFSDFATA